MRHLYAARSVPGDCSSVLRCIQPDGEDATDRTHDLEVTVARWSVHRQVRLVVGTPVRLDSLRTGIPLRFEDAKAPEMFPTFEGRIDLVELGTHPARTEIILTGSYTAPMGVAGTIGDHLLIGRTLGPATVQAVLADIATAVDRGTPALV